MAIPAIDIYIDDTKQRYVYEVSREDDGIKIIWKSNRPKIAEGSHTIHLEWGTGEIDIDCESVELCEDGYYFKVVGWMN